MSGSINTKLLSATHRGDEDDLVTFMQRRLAGDIAMVDGAGGAFHDWLQAWMACEEQRTHVCHACFLVQGQYLLVLPHNLTERCKVAYTNLHRRSIAYFWL